jgi:DNA topoisomerase I
MPKKYASVSTTLVIVESPTKCKIETYLGPGYKCVACYGHLRELPSLKQIDITNNFEPTYTIIDNALKKRTIEMLCKEIKEASDVILATDDDREGESIAWHICQLFKLNPAKTKRIVFHEITENAVKLALSNPRVINMDIVQAQQTRQILDVLVGFKVSPMLWKFLSTPKGKDHSLSAGRCQTPALRLVYENQLNIDKAETRQVYNIVGYFTNANLPFQLLPSCKIENKDELVEFLSESCEHDHIYSCSKPTKVTKQPPEPFTTSRLQQVSSNEFHYSPKDTMRICQLLYERGYITYMRTDSKIYSSDFIQSSCDYISREYGDKYFNRDYLSQNIQTQPKKKKTSKTETKVNTQDAHEAIRPTNISLKHIPDTFEVKERKLYHLIWRNALESVMMPAIFNSITATIDAPKNMHYSHKTELIEFAGWKMVENKYDTENKDYMYLQTIKPNMVMPYKKIIAEVSIRGNVGHYTEAMLIQLLEEKGIGRPATFASLVDKIQERGYVKKEDVSGKKITCFNYELENEEITEIEITREFGAEKNKLVIQPLGILVIEFLIKHFSPLFEYTYTSFMEEELDKISKGVAKWLEMCSSCNGEIDRLLRDIRNETKCEYQLDEDNTFIVGKYGPVIKCVEDNDGVEKVSFKSIKKEIDLNKLKNGEYSLRDVVDDGSINKPQVLCQYEGCDLVVKRGKYGLYAEWGDKSKSLKELGSQAIETISAEDVLRVLGKGSNIVREISDILSIRKGPKGDYIFYKTYKMKKPVFYNIVNFNAEEKADYTICDIDMLKSWITKTYSISL